MSGVLLALMSVSPGLARDKWLHAKTDHFEVFTNARESDAKILVARLEQFRDAFLQIVPGKSFREPRTTVVIFDSEKDFRPYKPLYKGKPKENIAGVFQGAPDEVVIALTTERDLEVTIPTVYHEYIHLLMHARGFRLPPWLGEGVAELYETMEFEDNRVKIGKHNPIHVMQLNRTAMMPLAKLFAITHSSPEYNEGDRRTIFYAQSWALLHYCLTAKRKGKELGEGFDQLITLMQQGYAPNVCVQQAYGMTIGDMEEELGSHVRGGRYLLKTYQLPEVDFKSRVSFRPASDFERDVALANLKWRLQRNGDATYHVMQLAEKNAASPRPLEVLAGIMRATGERKRAIDYWTEAAKLGTTNPYVYGELAKDSLRQYLSGASAEFRLSEDVSKELRGWLDRAVVLEPNYAEAWDWLAITEAYAAKPRVAVVNQLSKQREKFGNRPRLMAGVAVIALRINKPELAEQIADALLAMPSVTRRPSGRGQLDAAASQMMGGRSGLWTQRPEYYPDVAAIARSVKRELAKALGEEEPVRTRERMVIEFLE
jgi:tetratricopeptide (TPR) repeat protein